MKSNIFLLGLCLLSISLFAQSNSVKPESRSSSSSSSSSSSCKMGNCYNGWGVALFPSGNLYCGFFKNGSEHYFGAKFWNTGGTYIGTWFEGDYGDVGHGIEIWPDGDYRMQTDARTYWGETGCVAGDCVDGWGVKIYEGGGMHVGFWDDEGEEHLLGFHFWDDGDFWMGLYNHGDRKDSRQGLYCWEDGTTQEYFENTIRYQYGCLMGDCEDGWGAYRFESGNLHIGFWKNGVQNYFGTKFWQYSDFFFGLYKASERQKRGMYFYESGTVDPRTDKVTYN